MRSSASHGVSPTYAAISVARTGGKISAMSNLSIHMPRVSTSACATRLSPRLGSTPGGSFSCCVCSHLVLSFPFAFCDSACDPHVHGDCCCLYTSSARFCAFDCLFTWALLFPTAVRSRARSLQPIAQPCCSASSLPRISLGAQSCPSTSGTCRSAPRSLYITPGCGVLLAPFSIYLYYPPVCLRLCPPCTAHFLRGCASSGTGTPSTP